MHRALTPLRPARSNTGPVTAGNGQVAQLVEQRTENPRVGGSIPPLATISNQIPSLNSYALQSRKSAFVLNPPVSRRISLSDC